jgi:hypothetical protein
MGSFYALPSLLLLLTNIVILSSASIQKVFNIVSEGPFLRDVIDVLAETIKRVNKNEEIKFEALSPGQWSSKVEAKITHEFPKLYLKRDSEIMKDAIIRGKWDMFK